jgi:hypothetical protein
MLLVFSYTAPFIEVLSWIDAGVKATEFETLKAAEIRLMCDELPRK